MRLKINREHLKIIAVLLAILLFGGLLFTLLSRWESHRGTVETVEAETAYDDGLYLDGVRYAPKKGLETILLIGVDKYGDQTQETSYNNSQQSDFLMLLVLDKENNTRAALHLNRDTMTEIPVLGVRGEAAGSIIGQLALAHTYGSGGADSCRNTVDAVSGLLYGISIDHYVAFTMDAVGQVNDMVGGVTLTMLDDFSSVSSEMQQGAVVTLTGDMALAYVRTRYGLEDSSNLHRMERQRQYLTELSDVLTAKIDADDGFLLEVLDAVSAYMVSDCTASQLSQAYDRWEGYEDGGILTMEGTAEQGAEFMEFYPDEAALRQLVAELFYTPLGE